MINFSISDGAFLNVLSTQKEPVLNKYIFFYSFQEERNRENNCLISNSKCMLKKRVEKEDRKKGGYNI